ncbi:MAG: SMP-30/gluconolactonase/LRE family protein [Verrucomicrobia bacterium]|nr:SMP-30/gluconolactonase/LRE family protein [Verrucomicrobiota bacterium]
MKRFFLIGCMVLCSSLMAQDMPLSQILIPGERWELVECMFGFTDAPTADDQGNFYVSDMKEGLYRINSKGEMAPFLKPIPGISGMKFGLKGKKLYACRAKTRELVEIDLQASAIKVLAKEVRPNDLVVTHKGFLYFTETPKKQVTFYNLNTGEMKAADVGITAPNGICLSPDQGTLVVSDFKGPHCWAFRVEPDGSLKHKQPYMTMRSKGVPTAERELLPTFRSSCRGDGMITDAFGRYYVATELGVQYFDPTGRISGVIPGPLGIRGMTSVTFAGPDLEYLYATCFTHLYRLKTKTRGVLYQNGPQAYPPKK